MVGIGLWSSHEKRQNRDEKSSSNSLIPAVQNIHASIISPLGFYRQSRADLDIIATSYVEAATTWKIIRT